MRFGHSKQGPVFQTIQLTQISIPKHLGPLLSVSSSPNSQASHSCLY